MRLVWFVLHGYKRFEARTDLHLDGRLIALTGPNEAGKSSLLAAFTHLNDRREIPAGELTRRTTIPADRVVLRWRFLLEADDVAAIAHLNGGNDVRWLTVDKLQDGTVQTAIEPRLTRNLKPRQAAVAALRKLEPKVAAVEAKAAPVEGEKEGSEVGERLTARRVSDLAVGLEVDVEDLDDATKAEIESVRSLLASEAASFGAAGKKAEDALAALGDAEGRHPNAQARGILYERTPEFLLFSEDERTLHNDYDLVEDVPQLSETAALRNLASLADLDLEEVTRGAVAEDWGLVDTLTDRANERLAERFRVSWRQSEVTVRFRIDERQLRLLIESPHEPSSRIDERSDGMRTFIALLAYTQVRSEGVKPVLLIDEAEQHLHYAAQADLVEVLTEQTAAAQVIYTTHSAGCLPEDLGTGVRLVVPLEGADRSKVTNWFYEDEPGFGPLLHGMGIAASAFAFTPARFVVFAEGATELVLLPTLLRETTGRRALDFQIAPGLALVNRETASHLELEAGRVKYIVDSDQGGREIAAVLRAGGVVDADIFELRDGSEDVT